MLMIGILAGCGTSSKSTPGAAQDTKQPQQTKTLTMGLDPYNYATMPAYLTKEILENHGYKVTIKHAQVGIIFAGLANGKIDAYADIWAPNLDGSYLKKYKGDFDFAGTIYKDAPLGIAVPKYMKKVHSIPDLKKYHDKFSGKIYTIEPGTGMDQTTKKMIEAYNMKNFKQVKSSEQGMLAQLQNALSKHNPVAIQGWEPHTMFKKFPIKLLKDPKNVWKFDSVKIGVTPDLKEKSPLAYTLFSNMSFSIDEVDQWLLEMKDQGKKAPALAKEWVKNHPDRVKQWLGK